MRKPCVIFCEGCGDVFCASKWNAQFCDDCRKNRKKEQTKRHVADYRARQHALQQEMDMSSSLSSVAKRVTLECGHELLFRLLPVAGEDLFCARCDKYREYTEGKTWPMCPQGIHRMTPYNVVPHPERPRKRCCRRCLWELGIEIEE